MQPHRPRTDPRDALDQGAADATEAAVERSTAAWAVALRADVAALNVEPYDPSPERDAETEAWCAEHGVTVTERSAMIHRAPAGVSVREAMSARMELVARRDTYRRAPRPTLRARRPGCSGRPRSRARRTPRATRAGPSRGGSDDPGDGDDDGEPSNDVVRRLIAERDYALGLADAARALDIAAREVGAEPAGAAQ